MMRVMAATRACIVHTCNPIHVKDHCDPISIFTCRVPTCECDHGHSSQLSHDDATRDACDHPLRCAPLRLRMSYVFRRLAFSFTPFYLAHLWQTLARTYSIAVVKSCEIAFAAAISQLCDFAGQIAISQTPRIRRVDCEFAIILRFRRVGIAISQPCEFAIPACEFAAILRFRSRT